MSSPRRRLGWTLAALYLPYAVFLLGTDCSHCHTTFYQLGVLSPGILPAALLQGRTGSGEVLWYVVAALFTAAQVGLLGVWAWRGSRVAPWVALVIHAPLGYVFAQAMMA